MFGGKYATLLVVFVEVDPIFYADGFMFTQRQGAGISLFFSRVPERVVVFWEIDADLVGEGFDFL